MPCSTQMLSQVQRLLIKGRGDQALNTAPGRCLQLAHTPEGPMSLCTLTAFAVLISTHLTLGEERDPGAMLGNSVFWGNG